MKRILVSGIVFFSLVVQAGYAQTGQRNDLNRPQVPSVQKEQAQQGSRSQERQEAERQQNILPAASKAKSDSKEGNKSGGTLPGPYSEQK